YSTADLKHIVLKAKKINVKFIMTTEKDYMRIYQSLPWSVDLVVVGVKIEFEETTAFQKFLKSKLQDIENLKK
ncbi:MAG: tetraacyldisaccharide 4'-kinase, partial [Desulfobacterales bacterium]|nr:tetraacyldisaccharide 4'-kinase [Desulfobacterales bacterium]